MSKNKMQLQRKVHKPSAINPGQQAKADAYALLTEPEKANIARLSIRAKGVLELDAYQRGVTMYQRHAQRVIDAILHMERLHARLFRRCDHIDVLAATLEGGQLQQVLSGDIKQAIEADYKAIVSSWNDMNRARVLAGLSAEPDYNIVRPEVARIAQSRVDALDALAVGNFALIQSLRPLDQDLDKLLKRAKKLGRKGNTLDWLKARWRAYEADHPGENAGKVRAALLDELATWDQANKVYMPLEGLTQDQQNALKTLSSDAARRNPSGLRYDLIER